MSAFLRIAALAGLIGLAGCVGGPVGQPFAYGAPPVQPGYAPAQAASATQVAYGGTCYAGVYTCGLVRALPVGSQCACPGLGAPSYGAVR